MMMKDILEEIVAHKRQEVEEFKQQKSWQLLQQEVECLLMDGAAPPSMAQALKSSPTGIIAEFKRKSPSKGWIKEEGNAAVIPLGYQQQGATAVSILTDSHFFGGADAFITTARRSGVTIPILYKNFVIDEYQLLQARHCGASAVLLIAACLSKTECARLTQMAHRLQLEVLLEMHHEKELEYAEYGADMFGINNRSLGTFVTDVQHSFRMASLLPQQGVKVSESGISSPSVIKELREVGYQGFLIGENVMKQEQPSEALHQFIAEL